MKLLPRRTLLALPLLGALLISATSLAKSSRFKGESYGVPFAVLSTPKAHVEIFRTTRAEDPNWPYMVVWVDEDGSQTRYGDEHTVGKVLDELDHHLTPELTGKSGTERCPASMGWRYQTLEYRASYCNANAATARIERAVGLLETIPSATP